MFASWRCRRARAGCRGAQHLVTPMGDTPARSHMMDMHRALETTTGDYVERVAQGSDDYSALLRRLEAAHRLPASRSRAQVGPAPAQLPHMLNAVDTTLDGMIKRLELELQHRTPTDDSQLRPPPPPPSHDAAATALSAQLRRVLASSRSQVERDLLASALREAESETTTVVCSRTPRHAHARLRVVHPVWLRTGVNPGVADSTALGLAPARRRPLIPGRRAARAPPPPLRPPQAPPSASSTTAPPLPPSTPSPPPLPPLHEIRRRPHPPHTHTHTRHR